jgi:endo-1,4-beta-xylanase
MKRKFTMLLAMLMVMTVGYAQSPEKGLKDYYADYFTVGVAVSPRALQGPEADLIKKHFNSLTAENAMKMGPSHPEENRYFFDDGDKIAAFAKENKMKLRGHTLCWHNQTPKWLFVDAEGKNVTKEILLKRLKDHITAVVSRYKGTIYAWDVVNEVIDDAPDKFYRESLWYTICGEEYIAKAFEYAHEADPSALLFYNDYNTESPTKRENIYKMVKKLIDAKVPIHGVGLQGHWSVYEPNEAEIKASIEKFAALGLKVQITELDVSIYPLEHSRRQRRPDEPDQFTPELEQKQIAQYKMAFRVFREKKSALTGITFWNVSDKNTWLDNFPVSGRKNYPLLFDVNLQPKKVYWEVVKF